jgi:cell division protein FtsW (lipid II flippase)
VNRGEEVPTAQASLQLVWTAVALVFFLVVLLVVRDHTVLQSYAYTLALVGVLFLAVPAVLPASLSEVNGAQIWIKVPGLFSIQPAEFAKIALIIFAAAFLVSKRTVLSTAGKKIFGLVLPRARDLGPLIVALLLALLVLVRGKDLGTALLLFGTLLAMIYVATGRVSWLIIGVLGFAGGAYLAYRLFSHVRVRVDIWLDPFGDPLGAGYQLVQSLFGLGTGGIFGTGLGAGRPRRVDRIPTDGQRESGGDGRTAVPLAHRKAGREQGSRRPRRAQPCPPQSARKPPAPAQIATTPHGAMTSSLGDI